MATFRYITKNLPTADRDPNDIGNVLYTSRYEKAEFAFGLIPVADFAAGDTLAFPLAAREIVSAKFWNLSSTITTLEVPPKTNLTSPIRFPVGSTLANIAFKIEYVRGVGQPDSDTTQGQLLEITPVLGTS